MNQSRSALLILAHGSRVKETDDTVRCLAEILLDSILAYTAVKSREVTGI